MFEKTNEIRRDLYSIQCLHSKIKKTLREAVGKIQEDHNLAEIPFNTMQPSYLIPGTDASYGISAARVFRDGCSEILQVYLDGPDSKDMPETEGYLSRWHKAFSDDGETCVQEFIEALDEAERQLQDNPTPNS